MLYFDITYYLFIKTYHIFCIVYVRHRGYLDLVLYLIRIQQCRVAKYATYCTAVATIYVESICLARGVDSL